MQRPVQPRRGTGKSRNPSNRHAKDQALRLALTLLFSSLASLAAAQRVTPYAPTPPLRFASTTGFQACTWDRDSQKCTMFIRMGMFLSRRADMDRWPGESWGLAGKYVWGCSYEDNKANCDVQTRWNNCEWDPTQKVCQVSGAYTHSVMSSHIFACADAKVSDFLICTMQRKADDCIGTYGCTNSTARGMDGKPLGCVPTWYARLDTKAASEFQAQFADTSSALWNDCPYAKVVKSYKDTCYDYSNPVLCNEDSVCYWSISAGNCVPKDWAMATIVWGGDYKTVRTGLNAANQCRETKDATTCLSKQVKLAPVIKYAPPPRKLEVQQAPAQVSRAAGLNAQATKVQNATSYGEQQMMIYNQMATASGIGPNSTTSAMLGNGSLSITLNNGAVGTSYSELLTIIATAIGIALAAVGIGLI